MMKDNFQNEWEQSQLDLWKEDAKNIEDFFGRFDVEIKNIYNDLFGLQYDQIQPIIYLLGKIKKVMAICDFLDTLAKNNHEDVDKIKIFHLISHAEIIMNTPSSANSNSELVDQFFKPVENQLLYSLRLSINGSNNLSKQNQNTSASTMLYKLRCEYAHQGNFTGKVFRFDSQDVGIYNQFSFDWDLQGGKKQIPVCGETNLTWNQFLNIYFSAFTKYLENYISSRKKIKS